MRQKCDLCGRVRAERIDEFRRRAHAAHEAEHAVDGAAMRVGEASRNRLRVRFARLFRRYNPGLSGEEAYRIAEVTLQVVKRLNALYAAAKPKERKLLIAEYNTVVSSYLLARLG